MELHSITKQQWVEEICKNFNEDQVNIDLTHIPLCVFNIPKSISRHKPEAYAPQAIAFGPYHHFDPHLYQMERHKVAVVKKILDPNLVHSFESSLIDKLKEAEPMIRACYHNYLDVNADMLAWIVAIDGLFLLDVLKHQGELETLLPKKLFQSHIIYRDMMVLENQIPLLFLTEIQKRINTSYHDDLISKMIEFCKVHSPLELTPISDLAIEPENSLHLLDLMYHLIVNIKLSYNVLDILDSPTDIPLGGGIIGDTNEITKHQSTIDKLIHKDKIAKHNPAIDIQKMNQEEVKDICGKLGKLFGKAMICRGIRIGTIMSALSNIPWEKISQLLGFKMGKKSGTEDGNDDDDGRIEEIDVPSASSLHKHAKIRFKASKGGIRDVRFEATEGTLHLPVIILKAHSEVVLRNLVVYEVTISSSTMELAKYVDFMSGIIDTEEDVVLLKRKKIIKGNLKNNEIVELFNGVNKSNECSRGFRYETVVQLNEYYNKRISIKVWKFVKKQMQGSRKVLSVVFTVLACLLFVVYSFCEVYGCPRLFDKTK